jgi:molybdopterin/thiamine biosynthesis adenylyltransferase
MTVKPLQFSHPSQEDNLSKRADNEEYLSELLKQQLELTGEVEQAIELLVVQEGVPKRIAESLACGLHIFPKRYQLNAGTFGNVGQKHLLRSKVMVAGLGGLGGHVVEQLVRCGLGILLGVDADVFDETNLNRQLYSDLETIGFRKTEATQRRVVAINDAVEFHSFLCKVEDLEDKAYDGVDLIFDCLDAIPSRLNLQEVGERLDIPIIHGAIGGWYGQVAIVWPGSKLLSNVYGTRQEGIEKTLGNPPFTPAFIASFMVSEGIKVLLGKKERENTLFFADLLNNQWHRVSL